MSDRRLHGNQNDTLLVSVPLGVTTWTLPLLAPAGTVAIISVLETTVKTAPAPLKLTPVAPLRLVPRISTPSPTSPAVGRVSTNGPSPIDRLKTAPTPFVPPYSVIP